MRSDDLHKIPTDLSCPIDDGAANHISGMILPGIELPCTSGQKIDLAGVTTKWLVIYCYPRTGRPDREPVGGVAAWNAIPGARGCTPQSCGFRDLHSELADLDATVFGLSTQSSDYQKEAVERLQLPFELLSDSEGRLTNTLSLPTFSFAGEFLIKRLTLIARAGKIERVHYPVFPPDADAARVLEWIRRSVQA